ncbi:hypothetical protein A3D88_03780 [Candidatus Peribacteria bacterium RIFCSPHIGHO2_02_FULL_52_16]|nr:MAG: hypothetical protein A2706_04595 [Candidatus Peribacteria bacterium RIFCSPHIGHO2_01_FULL_51_35]OGJ61801.1 MAG: hypothetical protein A3D88_03780 [Candidatus Peribacteria bacterium RIFCSPHIGHO2_02_FULL_52_16]
MQQSLGSYINGLRQKKGFTLRDVAKKVDMDFTYLSKIENDKLVSPDGKEYSVSLDNLQKIARALDGDLATMQLLAGKMPQHIVDEATGKKKATEFFRAIPKQGLTEKQWEALLDHLPKQNP